MDKRIPAYQRVYQELCQDIRQNLYAPEKSLPAEPELARRHGVSIGTLRRATELLEREGRLQRRQGKGSFVVGHPATRTPRRAVTAGKPASLAFGVQQPLFAQAEICATLFPGQVCRPRPLGLPAPGQEPSPAWQQSSLVQLPLTSFAQPELQKLLAPLPEELAALFPDNILRECRALDGSLRLLPLIANMTVAYHWQTEKPECDTFSSLDYAGFLDHLRRLKRRGGAAPFGLHPFPGLFYEPLLEAFACTDFHDEALARLADFLQTLREENLFWTGFGQPMTLVDMFQRPDFQCTFMGPNPLDMLPDGRAWTVTPLPQKRSQASVFGLALPIHAPHYEEALDTLGSLYADPQRLAGLGRCAPASLPALDLWCRKYPLQGMRTFLEELPRCQIRNGRQHDDNFSRQLVDILRELTFGSISPATAAPMLRRLQDSRRIDFQPMPWP